MKTVEAVIEANGEIHLREAVRYSEPHRALVTIFEETPLFSENALFSQMVLARDWDTPEDDAAWKYVQHAQSK
jgi:hypothetical protein